MPDLQKFLALLLLKTAPQDFPYSVALLIQLAVIYVFSGIIVLQTTLQPDGMLAGLVLSLLVQTVFSYLVLQALNKSARFVQTVSALIGVSALFNVMSWPILAVLADENAVESMQSMMSLLFLLLTSWELLVKAHIFRHALEMKLFGALVLSFSLFFISVALSQLIFPDA